MSLLYQSYLKGSRPLSLHQPQVLLEHLGWRDIEIIDIFAAFVEPGLSSSQSGRRRDGNAVVVLS